jgi:probable F420-dependent oxidoreductase
MPTELGPLGVWAFIDTLTPEHSTEFAQKLEHWGYSALWLPEAVGRDPFCTIASLVSSTSKLVFATGIANIYARDPMAMTAIRNTLGDFAPGRFVMGLGVSHAHLVSGVRGHEYRKPVTTMRNYLDSMEKAVYMAEEPAEKPPIVLAALRRNMLKLSAERTRGAHPYFVTPEHTRRARELIGPDAWLCPEQKVLLESDPARARAIAREHMKIYLGLPNYRNNLLELGFASDELDNGGSNRLVDAIVAWGDEAAIRDRIQAHWDAGASHVCIQPYRPDGGLSPDLDLLERLAPGGVS